MANTHFRVEGLSSCYHDDETKRIFERCVDGSITKFITQAIVNYAVKLGFDPECDYVVMTDNRRQYIEDKIAKSRGKDYTYLAAFEYLRLHHSGASSSFIQREAIKSSTC